MNEKKNEKYRVEHRIDVGPVADSSRHAAADGVANEETHVVEVAFGCIRSVEIENHGDATVVLRLTHQHPYQVKETSDILKKREQEAGKDLENMFEYMPS